MVLLQLRDYLRELSPGAEMNKVLRAIKLEESKANKGAKGSE